MRSSQAAFDLIVAQEVSSKAYYEKNYRRPEWPGEQSGATVAPHFLLFQQASPIEATFGSIMHSVEVVLRERL